jgi:hypothetical protein
MIRLLYSLVIFSICNLATANDFGVQARLEKTVRYLRATTNIELHGVSQLWIHKLKGDYTSSSEFLFIASGQKYRKEIRSTSSDTNTIKLFETAYDGSLLATLNPSAGYMIQSSHDQLGDQAPGDNPLTENLKFLSKDSDQCKGCRLMFNAIISDNFLDGVNLTNVEKNGDLLQISFPGRNVDGRATTWKIIMGNSGDQFTPQSITRIIPREGEQTCNFETYTNLVININSNGVPQMLTFPSVISYSATAYSAIPSGVVLTGLTTVVSARIPEQIPDSTFRLDENLAKIIWSADKKDAIKGKPILKANEAKKTMAKMFVLSMFVITSVVFAILLIRRPKSE